MSKYLVELCIQIETDSESYDGSTHLEYALRGIEEAGVEDEIVNSYTIQHGCVDDDDDEEDLTD